MKLYWILKTGSNFITVCWSSSSVVLLRSKSPFVVFKLREECWVQPLRCVPYPLIFLYIHLESVVWRGCLWSSSCYLAFFCPSGQTSWESTSKSLSQGPKSLFRYHFRILKFSISWSLQSWTITPLDSFFEFVNSTSSTACSPVCPSKPLSKIAPNTPERFLCWPTKSLQS